MPDPLDLPFEEAIRFFRQKVRVPSRRWNDLWQGMHARGFMVAGAMRDNLLADFQGAILKGLEKGTTGEEFLKDFDNIVARHGWSYRGERRWRSRTIFETNLITAYAAGRYEQQTDPDVLRRRPFWMYSHGDSLNPRPLHLAWDGTILPADDPWWRTHYGPNGWGCTCEVLALSRTEAQRMGGASERPDNGTYEWTDPKTGEMHTVPNGIDPGWDYNVGEAYLGQGHMRDVLAGENDRWQDIPGKDFAFFGRGEEVPVDTPRAQKASRAHDRAALEKILNDAIGGENAVFVDPTGERIEVGRALVDHIMEKQSRRDGREQYFPMIPEIVSDPYEVWVGFARNLRTGRVALRRRFVKIVSDDKDRTLGLVADAREDVWLGVTFFRGNKSYVNRMRTGFLVWGR